MGEGVFRGESRNPCSTKPTSPRPQAEELAWGEVQSLIDGYSPQAEVTFSLPVASPSLGGAGAAGN